MKAEEKCSFELVGEWSLGRFLSFQQLYTPLIGSEAAQLYLFFLSFAYNQKKVRNHKLLYQLSGLSEEKMERARKTLEMFLLVKTYYRPSDNTYIYVVAMPKDPDTFLRHPLFGRMYVKNMGEKVYEFQKINFSTAFADKKDCQDLSAVMQDLLEDFWDEKDEAAYQNIRMQNSFVDVDMKISFNYDRFLTGLSKLVFPLEERNEKNLKLIGTLATVHGISEKSMVKYVSQSMIQGHLSEDVLRKKVSGHTAEYKTKEKDPYALPPVRFLQRKQHGIVVNSADKKLIERLLTVYQLPMEVVNVLIEYVLDQTNQKFQKAYVEKIAAEWVRLKIDTKDKAVAHVKEDQHIRKPKEKQLPEWYYDQESVQSETESFDEQELMEQMKALRGEV